MSTIELPLGGFIDYLRTRGAARVSVAHRHITQANEPYSPARDFYRRILSAILAARRSGDDRAVLRHAVAEAPASRRDNYRAVVDGWLKFLPQLKGTHCVKSGTGRWYGDGLTVKVTPHMAVQHSDGRIEALFLYFKADPLSRKDAEAMLWIAAAASPGGCPGAEPVVLDVRRGRAYRNIPSGIEYPAWLGAEAGGYRHLRRELAKAG